LSVRIVRLGSQEGLRLGTVRRPPRGVPKTQFASGDWYDVWFPTLAPQAGTVKSALEAQTATQWRDFVRTYRREMSAPEAKHALDLLARLSQQTDFSVGCYCADESRCHRSILRELLRERGAKLAE
jgi:uncharacterized protein YeaO (DUF488 family)